MARPRRPGQPLAPAREADRRHQGGRALVPALSKRNAPLWATPLGAVGPEVAFRGPAGVAGETAMLRNVSDPTLTLFRPAGGTANGTGVIVVPGGGWKVLFREHEGIDVARWLAAQGYAAFLPRYRVRGTPALQAEHDAEMARDQMAIDATRKGKIRRSSPEWHKDDLLLYRVVEGLYADWTDAGLSAERHIYRRGGHGFGMVRQGMPSDLWPEQLRHWLADPGLADPGLDQGLSSNPEPDGGERDKRGIAGGQLVPRVRLRRPEGWLHGSRRGGILRGGRPAARRHFIRGRGSPW